jgi:hypothetical protein
VDSIHDLGGMQGFGAVANLPTQPPFQHRWQAVTRALLMMVAGAVQASGPRSSRAAVPACPRSAGRAAGRPPYRARASVPARAKGPVLELPGPTTGPAPPRPGRH